MVHIFVISDGTGKTAKQTLEAALTQFPSKEYKINLFPEIRNQEEIHQIINLAAQKRPFIIHTIVSTHLRNILIQIIKKNKLKTIDLMENLLPRWPCQLGNLGQGKSGSICQLNQFNFRKYRFADYQINSRITLESRDRLSISQIITI
jgi:hypothetical protein